MTADIAGLGGFEYFARSLLGSPLNRDDGNEAGYQNDPHDPGNKGGHGTNYGVTQPWLDEYCQRLRIPRMTTEHMTEDDARDSYYHLVWIDSHVNAIGVSHLAPRTGLVYADGCVNMGRGWMVADFQRMLGVIADGWVGPGTLGALSDRVIAESDTIVAALVCQRRRERYESLHNFPLYGREWRRRLNTVATEAGLAWRWPQH